MRRRSGNFWEGVMVFTLLLQIFVEHPLLGIAALAILGIILLVSAVSDFYYAYKENIVGAAIILGLICLGWVVWKALSKLWEGYKAAESKTEYIQRILFFGGAIVLFGVFMYYRIYALGIAAILPVAASIYQRGVSIGSLAVHGIGLALIFAYLKDAPDMASRAADQPSFLRIILELIGMLFWWAVAMLAGEVGHEMGKTEDDSNPKT